MIPWIPYLNRLFMGFLTRYLGYHQPMSFLSKDQVIDRVKKFSEIIRQANHFKPETCEGSREFPKAVTWLDHLWRTMYNNMLEYEAKNRIPSRKKRKADN